jgi:hypothetical protein
MVKKYDRYTILDYWFGYRLIQDFFGYEINVGVDRSTCITQ